jgi:hypothetical protein
MHTLRPLGASEQRSLFASSRLILGGPQSLDVGWLRSRGFSAVPYPSASHFDEHDASSFARAISTEGETALRMLLLDDLARAQRAYRFVPNPEELRRLGLDFGSLNLLLLPEDERFAVLCTSDEFGVVAGPREFCEEALGETPTEARRRFKAFITQPGTPPALRRYFESVEAMYAFFD